MIAERLFQRKDLILIFSLILYTICIPQKINAAWFTKKKVTIICYMNGDNNLASEVLHAVDMMETVGSSEEVDIIALVDGMAGNDGGYGSEWDNTRLLHITKDNEIGIIRSRVIEEMGEKNLGDPQVLEKYIKRCLQYPSEKYIFILFSHGRGIIDTKSFNSQKNHKSGLLSPDETGQRAMNHQEFSQAIKNGLSGQQFHLMVFFSCLTNMVEVGYELRDLTRYMIASEDEIRIVNNPPGKYQIRGIKFEMLIEKLTSNLETPVLDLGKITIDSFIKQYESNSDFTKIGEREVKGNYPASLALVDCDKYVKLAKSLDMLAKLLVSKIEHPTSGKKILANFHKALATSQSYSSFLNLEYLDLQNILENLMKYSTDTQIRKICHNTIDILREELIIYERHTNDIESNGVSIFLPSFLVPENIYCAHRIMYEKSRFSKDTSWSELIATYRRQMRENYTEILIDEFELAYARSDIESIDRLNSKIPWVLRKDVMKGKLLAVTRYLETLEKMEEARMPELSLLSLKDALSLATKQHQSCNNLLKRVEVLIASTGNN